MYKTESGRPLSLGKELGKGGAATVYFHATDKSKAVKIFKPQILQKEINLAKRIEKLNQISQIADIEMPFGNVRKTIGAWPKDIVKDRMGNVVGYIMDTVNGGIDLSHVITAHNPKTAFYKYRMQPNYSLWQEFFIYQGSSLRNRFILSYYLSMFFDKMYNLKTKNGQNIELDICNFDIKPQNILVSIENIGGQYHIVPYILDLDNVTLKNSSGKLSPASAQITPEYKAPEGPIDKYYDYYSIAVIFHQLILNLHPFTFTSPGGTRFRDGTEFSYYRDNKCYPWGRNRKFLDPKIQNDVIWGNYTKLSPDIQQLFLRAFDSDTPGQRPSMEEWSKAISAFLRNPSVRFDKLFRYV